MVVRISSSIFRGDLSSIGIACIFVMLALLVLIILLVLPGYGQFSQRSLKRSTQVHTRQKLATTHVTLWKLYWCFLGERSAKRIQTTRLQFLLPKMRHPRPWFCVLVLISWSAICWTAIPSAAKKRRKQPKTGRFIRAIKNKRSAQHYASENPVGKTYLTILTLPVWPVVGSWHFATWCQKRSRPLHDPPLSCIKHGEALGSLHGSLHTFSYLWSIFFVQAVAPCGVCRDPNDLRIASP